MYEIIIKKTVLTTTTAGKEWQPLEKNGDKTHYGYTPEIQKDQIVSTQIYTQIVEDLDLVAVISAVNGMNVVTAEK